MKPITQSPTRRQFLQRSAAGAGVLAAGPWLARAGESPNGALRLGMIGTGERGNYLLGEILAAAARQNVRVVALCDVWRKNLESTAERVRGKQEETPKTFTRYGDLLATPDVDAVVIATPDFSHGTILNAALAAKKDVYIEKPMTIDLDSANRALDAARATERVVQVGTQRRSEGQFKAAAALIATGVLGPISRVTAEVNFNHARWLRAVADCVETDVAWKDFLLHLKERPFDATLLRRWQLHRETSNGLPGLWMTHYADAVHMLTGAKYPRAAVALGGTFIWKDGREHTDTFRTVLEYPEGFLFTWGMGLGNAAGLQFSIHGTRGTVDAERWTVAPEKGAEQELPAQSIKPSGGTNHVENWLECLRTRQRPNADIAFGHQHVVATVMPALALESGRRQIYDPAKRTINPG